MNLKSAPASPVDVHGRPQARLHQILKQGCETVAVKGYLSIPVDAVILPATRTADKNGQLALIAEQYRLPVTVCPLVSVIPGYQSPPEESGSYLQHAHAKAQRGCETLQEAGIDDLRYIVLGEDSGIELAHDVRHAPEFRHISNLIAKIPPDKPFPGVETGPILQACHGALGFFNILGRISERLQREDQPMDRAMTVRSTIVLSNPDNCNKTMSAVGTIKGRFVTQPQPAIGGIDIGNFFVPNDYTKTEAELGNSYIVNGPRAQALLALAHKGDLRPLLAPLAKPAIHATSDFRVGYIVDPECPFGQAVIRRVQGKRDAIILPANITRSQQIQTDIIDQADSFVVALEARPKGEAFYRNTLIGLSLMVHKQTHDPSIAGKQIALVSDTGEQHLFEKLYRYAHIRGQADPKPERAFSSHVFLNDAMQSAHNASQGYIRRSPHTFKTRTLGTYIPKRLAVGILTAAGFEEQTFLLETDALVQQLAHHNFNVVTGAGAKGGMGRVTDSVSALQNDGYDIEHYGASVENMMDREGHVEGSLNFFEQTQHRFGRMDSIIRLSDIPLLWQAGGAGSLEETIKALWLKHRSVHNPGDSYAQAMMGGKPTIIANGFGHFDEFEQAIPTADFRTLDIHVTRTHLQTAHKIFALAEEMQRNSLSSPVESARRILPAGAPLPAWHANALRA